MTSASALMFLSVHVEDRSTHTHKIWLHTNWKFRFWSTHSHFIKPQCWCWRQHSDHFTLTTFDFIQIGHSDSDQLTLTTSNCIQIENSKLIKGAFSVFMSKTIFWSTHTHNIILKFKTKKRTTVQVKSQPVTDQIIIYSAMCLMNYSISCLERRRHSWEHMIRHVAFIWLQSQ